MPSLAELWWSCRSRMLHLVRNKVPIPRWHSTTPNRLSKAWIYCRGLWSLEYLQPKMLQRFSRMYTTSRTHIFNPSGYSTKLSGSSRMYGPIPPVFGTELMLFHRYIHMQRLHWAYYLVHRKYVWSLSHFYHRLKSHRCRWSLPNRIATKQCLVLSISWIKSTASWYRKRRLARFHRCPVSLDRSLSRPLNAPASLEIIQRPRASVSLQAVARSTYSFTYYH
jgi:hypothetical protein